MDSIGFVAFGIIYMIMWVIVFFWLSWGTQGLVGTIRTERQAKTHEPKVAHEVFDPIFLRRNAFAAFKDEYAV